MNSERKETKQNPHISVETQYLKDLSFENPGAPNSLQNIDKAPSIDLSLDLNITPLPEENYFEVEIIINAEAKSKEKVLFVVDLQYAGVFSLLNIPEEQKHMLLSVHCPSIIFPFARKIIADATQSGGFQPLMIDPIDFGALYAKKLAEMQSEQGTNEGS